MKKLAWAQTTAGRAGGGLQLPLVTGGGKWGHLRPATVRHGRVRSRVLTGGSFNNSTTFVKFRTFKGEATVLGSIKDDGDEDDIG